MGRFVTFATLLLVATPAAGEEEGPPARGVLPIPYEVSLAAPGKLPSKGGRHWIGPAQPLPPDIEGEWAWTRDGRRVWRARLRAPRARAVRVRFEDFAAPGRVWLYARERGGTVDGPYGDAGPHGSGSFWSALMPDERVTIEYLPDERAPLTDRVPFRLAALARVTDPLLPLGQPGKRRAPEPRAIAGCHLDASCFTEVVERAQPAVAMLIGTNADGMYSCTGFLINPEYQTGARLLMLTTGHCVRTPQEAADLAMLWNYQTEECYGDPDWEHWTRRPRHTYGAELLLSQVDRQADFALLRVSERDIAAVTNWKAHGWDTALRIGDQVATVSHPDAGPKRVAFGEVVSHHWGDIDRSGFATVRWRLGTTEKGSSGSPIFRGIGEDARVVGVLAGSNEPETTAPWGPRCDPELRTAFTTMDRIYSIAHRFFQSDLGSDAGSTTNRITVALGNTGESVTIVRRNDDTWWIGNRQVESGVTVITASNGNAYTITIRTDASGEIGVSATYRAVELTVRLGSSNYRIKLTRAEDGSWWRGNIAAEHGDIIIPPNGVRYRLVWNNGVWTAVEDSG